jgi:uridine kinase
VLERYECDRISDEVKKILAGKTIYPPVYEPVSRQRLTERSEQGLTLTQGVLLVEGVIALALPVLRQFAQLKIFVAAEDEIRLQRLQSFYRLRKGLEQEASHIIAEREKEEVPFIKETAVWADVLVKL